MERAAELSGDRFRTAAREPQASVEDRVSSGESDRAFGLPVPGQKLVQAGLWRVGDPAEDVGEPGLRVDVVEPGGADERVFRHGRSRRTAMTFV